MRGLDDFIICEKGELAKVIKKFIDSNQRQDIKMRELKEKAQALIDKYSSELVAKDLKSQKRSTNRVILLFFALALKNMNMPKRFGTSKSAVLQTLISQIQQINFPKNSRRLMKPTRNIWLSCVQALWENHIRNICPTLRKHTASMLTMTI